MSHTSDRRTSAAKIRKRTPPKLAHEVPIAAPRRRSHLVLLSVVIILAAGLVITWFATIGIREGRAARFDDDVQAAISRQDYQAAYRAADFAAALKPTDDRKLSLGALAYINKDYALAEKQFRRARKAGPVAAIGQAAAAAQTDNDTSYEAAKRRLDPSGDPVIKLGLAYAAIDQGDLATAGKSVSKPISDAARYAKAVGELSDDGDITAAATAASEPPCDCAGEAKDDPRRSSPSGNRAYRLFFDRLNDVPEKGREIITAAIANANQSVSQATKKLVLSQGLASVKEYRAAESLASSAVRAEPRYRDGWQNLAAIQLTLRDSRGATRSLKAALDLDQASGYTWYLKSQLAEQQKDPAKSAEYHDKAKRLGYEER